MQRKRARQIIEMLAKKYKGAKPALTFGSTFELLIAVILSAQCTDERVNKVTDELFKEYNTAEKMLTLTNGQLEKYIFSCGLYKSKAKHILIASGDIVNKFGGSVPNNLKDLRSLAGVGRKTANVVYSVGFNGDAIAVDTHVFRVSNRLGLARAKTVLETEKQLMEIIDKDKWSSSHHHLIYHGRQFCKARSPMCSECFLNSLCEKNI